jgi:hypothetical protein
MLHQHPNPVTSVRRPIDLSGIVMHNHRSYLPTSSLRGTYSSRILLSGSKRFRSVCLRSTFYNSHRFITTLQPLERSFYQLRIWSVRFRKVLSPRRCIRQSSGRLLSLFEVLNRCFLQVFAFACAFTYDSEKHRLLVSPLLVCIPLPAGTW